MISPKECWLIKLEARSVDRLVIPACSKSFSSTDFFKDTPWLNVPAYRQTVFIAPLYPCGGLLGGSSSGVPKMSKLQALAAARKKKAQEQKSGASSEADKPMAQLSLSHDDEQRGSVTPSKSKSTESTIETPKQGPRYFRLKKRKNSDPHEMASKTPPAETHQEQENLEMDMDSLFVDQARPSAFANTMFGSADEFPARQRPSTLFTIPYVATASASADAFAGPSPDDVVISAQSKGSTSSAKPIRRS